MTASLPRLGSADCAGPCVTVTGSAAATGGTALSIARRRRSSGAPRTGVGGGGGGGGAGTSGGTIGGFASESGGLRDWLQAVSADSGVATIPSAAARLKVVSAARRDTPFLIDESA